MIKKRRSKKHEHISLVVVFHERERIVDFHVPGRSCILSEETDDRSEFFIIHQFICPFHLGKYDKSYIKHERDGLVVVFS